MDVHQQDAELLRAQLVKRHEERMEQWRKAPGDLDDFIFTWEHPKEASER